MAHLSGKAGYVDIGGQISGIKSWTLDYTSDALETTDFADTGVKSYIIGGSGWSGSFEGYKEGAAQALAGAAITLKLYESATAYWSSAASGAFITGVHPSVSHDGIVSVSYDFQGTGALSHTEA